MELDQFFENIKKQFHNQMPFVAYRKPNDTELKSLFQKDNTLHEVLDFNESGFVFSPFDALEKSILIPISQSNSFKSDFVIPKVSEGSQHEVNENHDQKQFHIKLVKKALATINENELKKVVLSRCETLQFPDTNPIALFQKLLNNYTTAFVYMWYHPKVGLWLGATPEALLNLNGNQLTTMALAGTQAFKGDSNVIWKEKEKEEQQLVTDFIVERLGSSVNTLRVSEPETVRAGSLLHLKTIIYASFKPGDLNLKEVLKALHPTPAVCGLPKERAKDFILNNENYNREFYTGFLGELNLKETITRNTNRRNVENNAYNISKTVSNLYVNLRCMQIKNETVLIYIGAGITKDSIPEAEWEETVHKSQIMKSVF